MSPAPTNVARFACSARDRRVLQMDEAEKLALFCGATGASTALGRGFLADFDGDVEQAVNAYFSTHTARRRTPCKAPGHVPSPLHFLPCATRSERATTRERRPSRCCSAYGHETDLASWQRCGYATDSPPAALSFRTRRPRPARRRLRRLPPRSPSPRSVGRRATCGRWRTWGDQTATTKSAQ